MQLISAPVRVRLLLKNRAHKVHPEDGKLCQLCDTAAWEAVVVCEACILLPKTHAKNIPTCPACAKTGIFHADHDASVDREVVMLHSRTLCSGFLLSDYN